LSTVLESSDAPELLLDLLYNIGGVLVEDDIRDFPWDPMTGGPGQLREDCITDSSDICCNSSQFWDN
jgi:hypothetical protein